MISLNKKKPVSKIPSKHSNGIRMAKIWRRRLREPLLTVLLTIQIITLFVVPSVRAAGVMVPQFAVFGVLLVFVILAIALSRSHVAIIMMIVSVELTIIGAVLHHQRADVLTDTVSAVGQVLAQLSLLWVVSTAVFGPGKTTHHRILGGIVMYLGLGMVFTSLDIMLAQLIPTAFTHLPVGDSNLRETLTYYSFSTLTTGSFGDIIPVHPIAHSLANLESICGQLFPATLLARIVAMHSSSKDS